MITAVVLAAGLSRRMGEPKLILPWGKTTVIGQVVSELFQAGLSSVVVVVGGSQDLVKAALTGVPVDLVINPDFTNDNMLLSLQVGLRGLAGKSEAALVVLGDQPQIENQVVKMVLATFYETRHALIVPSFQMRRGHPWLVEQSLWSDIFNLKPPATLRDFLQSHAELIHYLPVNTPTVLKDLDTPEDYAFMRPE